jgi:hypothetical protein
MPDKALQPTGFVWASATLCVLQIYAPSTIHEKYKPEADDTPELRSDDSIDINWSDGGG